MGVEALSPYLSTLPLTSSSDATTTAGESIDVDETVGRLREMVERATLSSEGEISDEEDDFGGEEICNIRFSLAYEGIWSRRLRAGNLEYEVKKRHVREKDNKYFSKSELLAMGFEKLLKQTDEKIAAKEAGLDIRPVTLTEVQKHLDDFGLAKEFGTYGKIRGLSGGQKV